MIAAIALYVLVGLALYVFQGKLIYFPSHVDRPPHGNEHFKPWMASNGDFLGYIKEAKDPKRVVVLFHGNGGEALGRTWLEDLVPSPDVVLILAEHPGYGGKDGVASEASLVAAGHSVIKAAVDRWHLPITVVGESLGTGVASAIAGDPGVDRLGLVSPFLSALQIAKDKMPIFPMALLMKDTYRSDLYLATVKVPIYITHGVLDDVLPFESGKALFESYEGGEKSFSPIKGASHNDIVPFLLKSPDAQRFRDLVRKE